MTRYSFPQARGIIAHTALRTLTRWEIVKRLERLRGKTEDVDRCTTRQLAYRLAYLLLPLDYTLCRMADQGSRTHCRPSTDGRWDGG